jgi:hypothetical protein
LAFGGDAARLAGLERHGLHHLRSSFTLARPDTAGPLPAAALPDGPTASVTPTRTSTG